MSVTGNMKAWKTYLTVHRRGEYEAALAGYDAAWASGFTGVAPLAAYGVLLLQDGRFEQALHVFDFLLEQPLKTQQRALARINRALAVWKLGRGEEAIEEMRSLESIYNGRVWYGCLGYVLMDMGHLDEAYALNLQGVDYCIDPVILDNLGQICYRRGQWEEATKWFEQALEEKPDQADTLYHLALLRRRGGDAQTGLELMRRARTCRFSAMATVSLQDVEDKLREWGAAL
nr:tetratricopeptide repeat protein [bacterium]